MNKRTNLLTVAMLAAVCAPPAVTNAQDAGDDDAVSKLRLSAPILNHAHRRALGLCSGDFNSDGRIDLAVVSNDESVLSLYLNTGDPDADFPFEKEDVTVDRRIGSMVATDVNGDGRVDLVLAGQPPSLIVYYQSEEGRLQKGPDLDIEATRLALGDLDSDGDEDLLIVDGREFKMLLCEDGELSLEPASGFFSTGEPFKTPSLADLNGDGSLDILFSPTDDRETVVVRLQESPGSFPSEFRVRTGQLRDIAAAPVPDGPDLVAAVHGQTYDLLLMELGEAMETDAARLALSDPRLIGFDTETRDDAAMMTAADVNGDGRVDLLVSTPSRASMRLLMQTDAGSFEPRDMPSFEDVKQVLAWPAADGEPQKVLVLSGDENTMGIAGLDEDSGTELSFPRPVALEGDPIRIALMTPAGAVNPALVAVETGEEDQLVIRAYPDFSPAGAGQATLLFDLSELGEEVTGLKMLDLNRDGMDDLVVFFEFEDPAVLMQGADGTLTRLEATGLLAGLLEGTSEQLLTSASLRPGLEQEVLVVKQNFVRAFHLGSGNEVLVSEQFNAKGVRPRLRDVVAVNLTDEEAHEIAVLDGQANDITVHGVRSGSYTVLRTVDLEEAGYKGLAAMDLDGDGRDDLIALAPDRIAVVYSRVLNGGLETVDSYESEVEDGGFGAVFVLPILDGPAQVAAVEMEDNLLEFFEREETDGTTSLKKFFGFRVFDIESMMRRRQNLDRPAEPREALTRDLDGDGDMDLVLLVHDKVIVYMAGEPAHD